MAAKEVCRLSARTASSMRKEVRASPAGRDRLLRVIVFALACAMIFHITYPVSPPLAMRFGHNALPVAQFHSIDTARAPELRLIFFLRATDQGSVLGRSESNVKF